MTARVAIAGVLIILQAFIHALGNLNNRWSLAVCLAYLFATLAVRLWASPQPPRSRFDTQWLSTIGVDVLAFSLLNFLQPGGINYTPLFALPVLLSSILGPIMLAFGTAATITLLLLLEAWWSSLPSLVEFSGRFLQSGLSGTGFSWWRCWPISWLCGWRAKSIWPRLASWPRACRARSMSW
jgi:two-component system, NtrC family, sensor histidine kinase PilS